MAKSTVIIFDGEDKFITKKKHVYNKNKERAEYVNAAASTPIEFTPTNPNEELPPINVGGGGGNVAPPVIQGGDDESKPIVPANPSPVITNPGTPTGPTPPPIDAIGGSPNPAPIQEPINPKQCASNQVWSYTLNKCITVEDTELNTNCGAGYQWDASVKLCMPIGYTTTTSTTTSTTTTAPIIVPGGSVIIPGLGIAPSIGGGGFSGGGGGGGSFPDEQSTQAQAAPKNYFWYYVAGGALLYYLLRNSKS